MTFPYFETPESPRSRSNPSHLGPDQSTTADPSLLSSAASSAPLTPVDGAEHQLIKDRMRAAEEIIAALQTSVWWERIHRDDLISDLVHRWRQTAAVYENWKVDNR